MDAGTKTGQNFGLAQNSVEVSKTGCFANGGLMAAEKTLNKINMDEWRWIIQGQIEGRKRDYTSGLLAAERRGIAKGELRGAQQNAIANAENFLKLNKLTAEEIAACCSLPLEQVLALKEEIQTKS